MKHSRRYNLTMLTAIVLLMLAVLAILNRMEMLATACVTDVPVRVFNYHDEFYTVSGIAIGDSGYNRIYEYYLRDEYKTLFK